MKKSFNKNRADQILNSFDGIQPSEVPPFFYTRLKARMERELEVRVDLTVHEAHVALARSPRVPQ